MFLIVKDDGRARVGVGRGVVNHQLLAAGGRFYSSSISIHHHFIEREIIEDLRCSSIFKFSRI